MARRLEKVQSSQQVDWKILVQALLIAGVGWWIYGPALHGGWLWDDDILVTHNAIVHDPAGWWKIWFEPSRLVDYQPIKVIVDWIEWRCWGNNTLGYHSVNVALHIISACLLWRFLRKFGLRFAWLGGLIFAVHPVMVESVAWISELKNTLSLPPFLLAMGFWIDYEEHRRPRDYRWALIFFLVAMLCKASMVMFPAVILLYAWWKRGHIGREDLKASAPFFAISLVLGAITLWFLHPHEIGEAEVPLGGMVSRMALAGLTTSFYFSKCILPLGLNPIYPQWHINPPLPWQFLPWLVLGALICGLWLKRVDWGRHALLGLGFFLIMTLPFMGFTAGTYMRFTWVMDHIIYIPIIGLIGLAVAALERVGELLPVWTRPFAMAVMAAWIALMAWQSHRYARIFVNAETFYTYTAAHNPQAWLAHSNLGDLRIQAGRIPEAIEQYEQAVRISPDLPDVYESLGNGLSRAGRMPEAIAQYTQAVRIRPGYAQAHYNLGLAFYRTNRDSEAIDQYQQALHLRPNYADALGNLGIAYYRTSRMPEAIGQFQQALRLSPDDAEAHYHLAIALDRSGRIPEAIAEYKETLRLHPNSPAARDNLAKLQARQKPPP